MKIFGRFWAGAVAVCLFFLTVNSGTPTPPTGKSIWADSVLASLSLDEKIAQLMMIRAYSNKDENYNQELLAYIEQYKIGGICFFQGSPYQQASLTNALQSRSKIPLMIGIDGEWGLAMRLDSVELYPRQMALGAGMDTVLIYQMGKEIAMQCKRVGVHVNFAPCVDVNSNAKNPVINSRSFGGDPHKVSLCATAYSKGMQENGVMACAKHFPGHGDTEIDSHHKTPIISHQEKRLNTVELPPFQYVIDKNIDAVMVGHLLVPALDSSTNAIATCSKTISTHLLQEQMGFNGLIFTDGLEMGGIANLFGQGELEVNCLIAGCDMLLLPNHFDIVSIAVKQAILDGRISMEELDKKCLKVLKMKEKYVLKNCQPIALNNITEDINSHRAEKIYKQLTQKSITVIKNDHHILPLNHKRSVLYLREDKNGGQLLGDKLRQYVEIDTICSKQLSENKADILAAAKDVDYIIISLHNLTQTPSKNYGVDSQINNLIAELKAAGKPVILIIMGNAYAVNFIEEAKNCDAVIIAYHPVPIAEEAVAEVLVGKEPATGQLPISLDSFAIASSFNLPKHEETTRKSNLFYKNKIDELIGNAIREKAFPGCQVLIAKGNTILYSKNYGTYTYQDKQMVTDSSIYDLASLTKVMATTLALMKLYQEGKIDLNLPAGHYLPYLKGSNKENIPVYRLMTHTAGLQSWIPFYKKVLDKNNHLEPAYFSNQYSPDFAIEVAKNIYLSTDYKDSIYAAIIESKIRDDNNYLYSDLGFYLLADIVKNSTGQTLDDYLNTNFYGPMGLKHTFFCPLQHTRKKDIVPTENDTFFRRQQIQGYVHDQGAAMLGGVSGHAGLFSTAKDLYAICQMLLDGGIYNGQRYLNKTTIKYFSSYYYSDIGFCRRGLGFDKPSKGKAPSPVCSDASSLSFGHSGFTGTYLWIDPQNELIYIFLSNRVCPNAENGKLSKMNIRFHVHSFAYKMVQ